MPTPARSAAVDLHLFNEGRHVRLYEKLGAHPVELDGERGVVFRVWAPNARSVALIGGWNGWDKSVAPMSPLGDSGIWEHFVPGLQRGEQLQVPHRLEPWRLRRRQGRSRTAFIRRRPPRTGSIIWDLNYTWGDDDWLAARARSQRSGRADQRVRGAPAVVAAARARAQSIAVLPRTRAAADGARRGSRLHPRRVHADHGASRSWAPGDIRSPATSHRPAAWARRRTSCT